jgi:hypothetical protein
MFEKEIKAIEEEIRKTPYNKATQKHIGMLKAKLARLKEAAEKEKTKSMGKAGLGFGLKKSGDATVLLIGLPSVGKSTLLNKITNAESKVADYEFTTLKVIPGMMEYKGAKIQILDVPGIVGGASKGKGRGKEILSMARAADLICLMLDATKDYNIQLKVIKQELYDAGFRLGEKLPDVKIYKEMRGGLKISSTVKLKKIDEETIKEILKEFRILNGEIIIREDITPDQLIDVLLGNRVYVPFTVIVNKTDLLKNPPKRPMDTDEMIFISAKDGKNIEKLKEMMWKKLNLMRLYMKKIGKEPDMNEPLIIKNGSTVKDVCIKLHKEFLENFDYARIWGKSAKFPGQNVGLEHKLNDEDIVEIHLK